MDETIYYIIAEGRLGNTISYQRTVYTMIAVFDTDMSKIDDIYDMHVRPLIYSGRNIMTFCFYREPNNPFKAMLTRQQEKEQQ